MGLARRVVELGRAARSEAKVKTRQPLSRALLASTTLSQLNDEIVAEVIAELNVGALDSFSSAGDLVDYSAKGNFRALGKRFGKQTPLVAQAIADADAHALAAALHADGKATVAFEGGVEVSADEVIVSERPREGWSVVNEQGETVALDLELTPELVRKGLLRDVVRVVQEARKTTGFEVSDRITLTWAGTGEAADALREDSSSVADEVLATSVVEAESPAAGWSTDEDLGLSFQVAKA